MKYRSSLLGFILVLLTMPLFARDKTDSLVMKNGDHMTCEVKGLSAGVLYVSFDYIDGTTSLDWSKVAQLESKQLFVVKTEDGSVYTGTLRTPEQSGQRPIKIQVVETAELHTEIQRSQVISMVATSDKFWERFNGAINFGTTFSKGNESTQYSLGSQTEYVRERWSAQANYDSNLTSSTGVEHFYTELAGHIRLPSVALGTTGFTQVWEIFCRVPSRASRSRAPSVAASAGF